MTAKERGKISSELKMKQLYSRTLIGRCKKGDSGYPSVECVRFFFFLKICSFDIIEQSLLTFIKKVAVKFEIQGMVFSLPPQTDSSSCSFEKRKDTGVYGKRQIWAMTGNNAILENLTSDASQIMQGVSKCIVALLVSVFLYQTCNTLCRVSDLSAQGLGTAVCCWRA